MANTHSTNVTFTLDIVFGPGDYLICALFLTFEFGIIVEIVAFENNGGRLKIFLF